MRHHLRFVGTATTLLELGPFTLLTDPNFLRRGQYAYLGKGLVSRRLTEPALGVDDLPPLDAVVLSHLHGDHFDRVARRGLDRSLPVLTTPAAASRLGRWGFGAATGMRTWQQEELVRDGWRLTVTAAPGRHGPGPVDALLPPVMGSVLELAHDGAHVLRVYVTGDTLRRPWLADVTRRHGPLDAAVVHLGGTRILGLLVTMDARQGADLVEMLRPAVTVPVHQDDYTVFRSGPQEFAREWRRRGPPGELRAVQRGGVVDLLAGPSA
jgi:L-ascorbate metabolism protein UlaG (beta-lactamase superfamily)